MMKPLTLGARCQADHLRWKSRCTAGLCPLFYPLQGASHSDSYPCDVQVGHETVLRSYNPPCHPALQQGYRGPMQSVCSSSSSTARASRPRGKVGPARHGGRQPVPALADRRRRHSRGAPACADLVPAVHHSRPRTHHAGHGRHADCRGVLWRMPGLAVACMRPSLACTQHQEADRGSAALPGPRTLRRWRGGPRWWRWGRRCSTA